MNPIERQPESLTWIHRPDGDHADGQEGGHYQEGGQYHPEDNVEIFIVRVCERNGLHRVVGIDALERERLISALLFKLQNGFEWF